MALKSLPQSSYNYVNGESARVTRINIFEYQRPTPNAKLLKNLLGSITLPLPDSMPADSYAMDVADTDLGMLGMAQNLQNGNSITALNQTLRERIGDNSISGLGAWGITGAAVVPGVADLAKFTSNLGLGNLAGTAQSISGLVRNPHTALLFNNVRLRDFTFNWKLSPRNLDQSNTLNQIIKLIKIIMHPDIEASGFALSYPNLVTMEFNNDKEGILYVDYAFITSFSVNPTPSGHAYYRNGYPSILDLQMHVKEISIKTAEDFADNAASLMGTNTGPSLGGGVR